MSEEVATMSVDITNLQDFQKTAQKQLDDVENTLNEIN